MQVDQPFKYISSTTIEYFTPVREMTLDSLYHVYVNHNYLYLQIYESAVQIEIPFLQFLQRAMKI